MSHRTESRHFLTCDRCEKEHHKRESTSALEARIAAGIDGWLFRREAGGRKRGPWPTTDLCPACRRTELA